MTRQSLARVSSASTEADFAPAMTPFDWEAAPGRPGRKSTKSGFSENTSAARRDSFEAPPLPFPPGRRPKDGYFLPYSRADESHDMQSEVKFESGKTSQPRKLFNLKFPGSSKKLPSTSRMRLPFQSSSKPSRGSHVEEDHSFGIFNPISGHRVGSSITRRMLEHFTKKQSLWRRCLPPKPESENHRQESSPQIDHNKGRRLDAVDEGYFTAADSPVSGPSPPSSPRHGLPNWSNSSPVVTKHMQPASPDHGHRHSRNSSPVATKQMLQPSSPAHGYRNSSNSSSVASRRLLQPPSCGHGHSSTSSPVVTKQLQVASSRFMASMLISLCPEADAADESQFDAVVDFNNDISISHMTTPRAKTSSPEALFETPPRPSECSEIVVDPASQTVLSHEECRCTCKHRAHISAKGDLSTPQTTQGRKAPRSVSRSLHAELVTARSPSQHLRSERLVQHEDSSNKLDQDTVAAQKDNADVYPMFFKASSNRESMRRKEPYHSTFSWKPCTEKSGPYQEPVAEVVTSNPPQQPGDSEFAKELYEDVGENFERHVGSRSVAQDFAAGSNSSSSSESNSRHSHVWSRPDSLSPSISRDVDIPPSKSNCGAAPFSVVGYLSPPRTACASCELGSENTSNREKPKALVRWKSSALEGRSERNQPPATRASLSFLSPPRKQFLQKNVIPSKVKIKDRTKTLRPSSQRRIPPKGLPNDDTDDSDEDSECSTDSSQYTTPRAVRFASPKPASPVVQGENLLESPSLLKFQLQHQQSYRESIPSPFMVDKETTFPDPSSKLQVLLARSRSVRSSSSRVFTPQECHAVSADTNFRGSDFAPASRLGRTSSSVVMSKVAEWESKAGVGFSGMSEPLYQFSQRTMSTGSTTIPYKPAAR